MRYELRENLKGVKLVDGTPMEEALTQAVTTMLGSDSGSLAHEWATYFVQNAAAGPGRKDLAEKHWTALKRQLAIPCYDSAACGEFMGHNGPHKDGTGKVWN